MVTHTFTLEKTNPGCSSLQNLKLHSELYKDIVKVDTCEVNKINIDEFLTENSLELDFDLVSLDTQGHDFDCIAIFGKQKENPNNDRNFNQVQ